MSPPLRLPPDPLGEDLRRLADSTDRLPADSRNRLTRAVRAAQADLAYQVVRRTLDEDRTRSAWSVAVELAQRLARFEATAWRRICNGHRLPRGALEHALTQILRCPEAPRSARRIVERF